MFAQVKLAWKWKTYLGNDDVDAYYLLLIIAVFKMGCGEELDAFRNDALFFTLLV